MAGGRRFKVGAYLGRRGDGVGCEAVFQPPLVGCAVQHAEVVDTGVAWSGSLARRRDEIGGGNCDQHSHQNQRNRQFSPPYRRHGTCSATSNGTRREPKSCQRSWRFRVAIQSLLTSAPTGGAYTSQICTPWRSDASLSSRLGMNSCAMKPWKPVATMAFTTAG